jgi:hypothetical protein
MGGGTVNHKKIQTTVKPSGDARNLELGWVSGENLDRDIGEERERFSTIARTAELWPKAGEAAIQAVEVTGNTIVVVYVNGTVRVINYVQEGS